MAEMAAAAIIAVKWVASAVVGATVGGVTATGIAAVATKLAVTAAISMGASSLAAKQASQVSAQQLEFKADPSAGFDSVFGRTATGGHLVMQQTSISGRKKFDGSILNMFALLSACGPVAGIDEFHIQGKRQYWNNATGEISGALNDDFWLKTANGSPTQNALTAPTWPTDWHISLPEWTAAHRMRGFAHSWLSLYTNDDGVWSNGIDPRYVIRGVHCYDPRYDSTYAGGSGPQRINDQSTWVYSQNPYIIGLTYVVGWRQSGVLVGGVGANPAMIDMAAFVTAANVADFNNWKIGGVFNSAEDPWDVLRRMLSCGGGEPVASGAMISCVVNAPRTSIATITIDDVSGPVSIPAMKSRRERFNSVVPRYRSEGHAWEIVPAKAVTVDAYVTADGGLNRRELEYSYCQDAKQAGQLAAYDLVNGREFGPIAIPLKPKALGFKAGDAITIHLPESGLNNQLVIVKSRVPNYETCEVVLTVESETTAKHAFALGQTPHPPVTAGLTRPDFAFVEPPVASEWTTSAGSEVLGMPSIVITGTPDALPMIAEIVIEYRAGNDVPWVTWGAVPGTQRRIDVTGIAGLHQYGIAIGYRSIYGVMSARTILTDVTTPALISDGSGGLTDGSGNIIPAEDVLEQINEALDAAEDATDAANQAAADAQDLAEDLANQALQLNNQLTDLAGARWWDASTAYVAGDRVLRNGVAYEALTGSTNVMPPDLTRWKELGYYGSAGQALAISELRFDVDYNDAQLTLMASDVTALRLTNNSGATLPSTFDGGVGNWTASLAGSPADVANSSRLTIGNDPELGIVGFATFGTTTHYLNTRGVLDAVPDGVWRISIRGRVTSAVDVLPTVQVRLRVQPLDANYAALGSPINVGTFALTVDVGAPVNLTGEIAFAQLPTGTKRFRYGLVRSGGGGGTIVIAVSSLTGEVITDVSGLMTVTSALDGRMTIAENGIILQGSAITAINNTLSDPTNGLGSKASTSALNALQTQVSALDGVVALQGSAITSINLNFGAAGGENTAFNPSFESGTDGWVASATVASQTMTVVPSTLTTGNMLQIDYTGAASGAYWGVSQSPAARSRQVVKPSEATTMSAYVAGAVGVTAEISYTYYNASGTSIGQFNGTAVALTGPSNWIRLTHSRTAPASSAWVGILIRFRYSSGSAAGSSYIDQVQLERGAMATGWKDSLYKLQDDAAAQAIATSALSGQIDIIGGQTTVNSTALTNVVATLSSGNSLPSTFGSGDLNWTDQMTGDPAVVPRPPSARFSVINDSVLGVSAACNFTASGQYLATRGVINVEAGASVRVSIKARCIAKASGSTNFRLRVTALDRNYALLAHVNVDNVTVAAVGAVMEMAGVVPWSALPAGTVCVRFGLVQNGAGAANTTFAIQSLSGENVTDIMSVTADGLFAMISRAGSGSVSSEIVMMARTQVNGVYSECGFIIQNIVEGGVTRRQIVANSDQFVITNPDGTFVLKGALITILDELSRISVYLGKRP